MHGVHPQRAAVGEGGAGDQHLAAQQPQAPSLVVECHIEGAVSVQLQLGAIGQCQAPLFADAAVVVRAPVLYQRSVFQVPGARTRSQQ
ncbi:hypothetical protein D3C75_1158850 [compost metagenome]